MQLGPETHRVAASLAIRLGYLEELLEYDNRRGWLALDELEELFSKPGAARQRLHRLRFPRGSGWNHLVVTLMKDEMICVAHKTGNPSRFLTSQQLGFLRESGEPKKSWESFLHCVELGCIPAAGGKGKAATNARNRARDISECLRRIVGIDGLGFRESDRAVTGDHVFICRALGSDDNESDNATIVVSVFNDVSRATQTPVWSQNATIAAGQAFAPVYGGGSGEGNWQFIVASYTNVPGDADRFIGGQGTILEPAGELSPTWSTPNPGPYNIWVRKFGDADYHTSNLAGPYTLTVKQAQDPIAAWADPPYVGTGIGTAIYVQGGSGTGGWSVTASEGTIQMNGSTHVFYDAGPGDYTITVKRLGDSSYGDSNPKTVIVHARSSSQAAVSSTIVSLVTGQPFTPPYSGGSGTAGYQFVVDGYTNWPSHASLSPHQPGTMVDGASTPVTSWTPPGPGEYDFYVRRIGDYDYAYSTIAGPYKLWVGAPQAPITLTADASEIAQGAATTIRASGGSGAGVWIFSASGGTLAGAGATRAFASSTPGIYAITAQRGGDGIHTGSDPVTIQIQVKLAQDPVTSQDVTVYLGESFTPDYDGGSGNGAWQFVIGGHTNWPGHGNHHTGEPGTLLGQAGPLAASWTPSQHDNYTFWVRRLGDASHVTSAPSAAYTLSVRRNPTGSVEILDVSGNLLTP
ncbi:MAG: hypothetical protein ACREIA_13075, partial [Opitutaceae bacterium]